MLMAFFQRPILGIFPSIFFFITAAAGAEPTKVFYVGGFRASAAQMRCWESGARKNSPGDYEFEGVPYPVGAGAGFGDAVSGASAEIRRIVSEINSNPQRRYVVAGHSSGAAISNTIATQVNDKSRIKQVILDGFTTPRINGDVTCWGARGQDGKPSRNLGAMSACGAGLRVYPDRHCSSASQWCLHFVLVVKSTPPALSDFINHGYDGCESNLDWLR